MRNFKQINDPHSKEKVSTADLPPKSPYMATQKLPFPYGYGKQNSRPLLSGQSEREAKQSHGQAVSQRADWISKIKQPDKPRDGVISAQAILPLHLINPELVECEKPLQKSRTIKSSAVVSPLERATNSVTWDKWPGGRSFKTTPTNPAEETAGFKQSHFASPGSNTQRQDTKQDELLIFSSGKTSIENSKTRSVPLESPLSPSQQEIQQTSETRLVTIHDEPDFSTNENSVKNKEDTLPTEKSKHKPEAQTKGKTLKLNINLLENGKALNLKPLSRQPSSKRGLIDNIVPLSNRKKLLIQRKTDLTQQGAKHQGSGRVVLKPQSSDKHSFNKLKGESTKVSLMSLPSTSSDKFSRLHELYTRQTSDSKVSTLLQTNQNISRSQVNLPQSLFLGSIKSSKIADE